MVITAASHISCTDVSMLLRHALAPPARGFGGSWGNWRWRGGEAIHSMTLCMKLMLQGLAVACFQHCFLFIFFRKSHAVHFIASPAASPATSPAASPDGIFHKQYSTICQIQIPWHSLGCIFHWRGSKYIAISASPFLHFCIAIPTSVHHGISNGSVGISRRSGTMPKLGCKHTCFLFSRCPTPPSGWGGGTEFFL